MKIKVHYLSQAVSNTGWQKFETVDLTGDGDDVNGLQGNSSTLVLSREPSSVSRSYSAFDIARDTQTTRLAKRIRAENHTPKLLHLHSFRFDEDYGLSDLMALADQSNIPLPASERSFNSTDLKTIIVLFQSGVTKDHNLFPDLFKKLLPLARVSRTEAREALGLSAQLYGRVEKHTMVTEYTQVSAT